MTTRPTPAPALVPYIEGLPEYFEAAGLSVRLEVRRTDGKPLTTEDRESIAAAVESYQQPGQLSDEAISAAVAADLRAEKKATTRTKRAPSRTAARVARRPSRG